MGSFGIAAARLVLVLLWTLIMLPLYWPLSVMEKRIASPLVQAYWSVFCRIIGFEVVARGSMCMQRPVLYVCNHASYLDIAVLGGLLPGFFVAKQEVAGWPVFGFLSRLARTVFVERRSSRAGEQRDELAQRLEIGDSLILFPEGTSNDGNRVLPFKSSLFAIAERQGGLLPVQPISVAYTRLDGMPMGRLLRPFFAWYGDMTMAPHAWSVLGLGRVRVEVEFFPPLTVAVCGTRKHLALKCHRLIADGVARANSGRVGQMVTGDAGVSPAAVSPARSPVPS